MKPRPLVAIAGPVSELEEALERLLLFLPGADPTEIGAATERAIAMHGLVNGEDSTNLAVLTFLADLLVGHAPELPWSPEEIAVVLDEATITTGVPRALAATPVYLRAVRDPRLLELSPPLAV